MRHRISSRARLTALGLVGGALFVIAPASASAASSAGTRSPVHGGLTTANLPNKSSAFGTTAPSTPETVAFVLQMRDESQLASAVEGGMTSFLSVSSFAGTYGQTQPNITSLESYLAGYDIKTSAYADGLDVVANGTASQFDAALDESQQNYHVPAVPGHDGGYTIPAQTVHAVSAAPSLPSNIASYVTAILGLTNYGNNTSNAEDIPSSLPQPSDTTQNGHTTCADCQTTANFAQNYGLNPLYAEGREGQGETIGIITLASVDPGAPEYYWTHVLHQSNGNRPFDVINVDGGAGTPSYDAGSSETDLDVEQAGGIAPGANIILYQASNTDYGFADAYFAAASSNAASSISTSWGEDETGLLASIAAGQESSGYAAAFDEALLEMAAQGQSTFAPAGDDGPYEGIDDLGTTDITDLNPGDSPYTTSDGGTTLPWSGTVTSTTSKATTTVTVPAQRAWGWDYLWAAIAKVQHESLQTAALSAIAGGGGGYSVIESRPSYQDVSGTSSYTAVPYLTPTDPEDQGGGFYADTELSFNANPRLIHGSSSGRVEPDVSADADPYSGYYLYSPSFDTSQDSYAAALEPGWGGTSFVGPQLNGSTAVFESALGHRIGLWNPELYAAAASGDSPVTPLSSASNQNDDLYFTGTQGTLYNPASGLGFPNLAELESEFANH